MLLSLIGEGLGALVLGLAPWAVGLLVAVFVMISVVLVLAVLIQKPQGGGLSGAFGAGGGSGQTAFGTKTGDVLTMTTISIFVLWLVLTVVLNFAMRPQRTEPGPGVIESGGEPASTQPAATQPASAPPVGETPDAGETPPGESPEGGTPSGTNADESGGEGSGDTGGSDGAGG